MRSDFLREVDNERGAQKMLILGKFFRDYSHTWIARTLCYDEKMNFFYALISIGTK
jgi:hypothetical protein